MKLDLKEWINKVSSKFTEPVGAYETVTFPFTATKAGICIIICTPATSSPSYLYIKEDGSAHARSYSTNGITYTMIFPVVKGKTYAVDTSSNYTTPRGIRIYPIMGGVVRKLLKALKPLTLERGWAV